MAKETLKKLATEEAHKWADQVKEETNCDVWRECFECYKAGYKKAEQKLVKWLEENVCKYDLYSEVEFRFFIKDLKQALK